MPSHRREHEISKTVGKHHRPTDEQAARSTDIPTQTKTQTTTQTQTKTQTQAQHAACSTQTQTDADAKRTGKLQTARRSVVVLKIAAECT